MNRSDYDASRRVLDDLDATCARDKRTFTADEQATYDGHVARIDAFNRMEATASVNRSIGIGGANPLAPQAGVRDSLEGRVGDFAHEAGRSLLGRIGNQRFAGEVGRVVAHGVAADGTAPVTIEGDVVAFIDAQRYAINAGRRLPLPDNHAPTFKRPRLTQATTVAQQVTEGDVLSSQRLQLTGDTVTKTTRGGVLALSEQEVDWTDPAMLGQALVDLARSYAIATDTVFTAAIVAAASDATETILAAALPTAANFTTAITSAAAVVYSASKQVPDVLFCDVNWWSRILGIVDLDGRPVFPVQNPQNAAGGAPGGVNSFNGINVYGLKVVVDPTFPADTLIVAASQLCEWYEQPKGLLSVNVPSTMEVQYRIAGYCATNIYSQGLGLIEAV